MHLLLNPTTMAPITTEVILLPEDIPTEVYHESNTSEAVWSYGSGFFQRFAAAYEPIHLPLSVMICLFGVVANTLNVIVLTRRSMASPTNVLLTGLSAAQLFLLMNYLLLLTFNVCASSCLIPALHSYPAVAYKWINVNISVAFHTIALMHTLVLAIFRFLAVETPAFARTRLTIATARACVITLYAVVPFLCAPTFFTSHVARIKLVSERSAAVVCYLDDAYDLDYVSHTELLEAAMWMFGIFFKLVPSLTISILSIYLIISLRRYQEKKARLTGKGLAKQFEKHEYRPLLMPAVGLLVETRSTDANKAQTTATSEPADRPEHKTDITTAANVIDDSPSANLKSMVTNNNSIKIKSENKPSRQRHNNVTKMLVAVALLCVSVELPHGIINLLTAVFGQSFGMEVYDNLGDFFEMLTLLYSSVNFVLYCIMSMEFQRTFRRLFLDPFREAVVRKISRKSSEFQSVVMSASGRMDLTIPNPGARDQSVQTVQRK